MIKILEEKKEGTAVFSLEGRLDSTTSTDVDKKILDAINNENIRFIILDFSKLEYLSSAGIRILVHCHKEIEKVGGKIVLASLPKPIEHVLYITGFLPYFKIYDSISQAKQNNKS